MTTAIRSLGGADAMASNRPEQGIGRQVQALKTHLALRRQMGQNRPITISVACQDGTTANVELAAIENIFMTSHVLTIKGTGLDGRTITKTFDRPTDIKQENIF